MAETPSNKPQDSSGPSSPSSGDWQPDSPVQPSSMSEPSGEKFNMGGGPPGHEPELNQNKNTGRPRMVVIKPPPLFKRTLLLLAEPRSWAKSALFPFRSTLVSLVLVAIISGGIIGSRLAGDGLAALKVLARGYDSTYAPMLIRGGVLSVVPGSKNPPLRLRRAGILVQVAATAPVALPPDVSTAITITPAALDVRQITGQETTIPMARMQRLLLAMQGRPGSSKTLLAQLPPVEINSATLGRALEVGGGELYWVLTLFAGMVVTLVLLVWSVMMALLSLVLVVMVNRDIAMPGRVAIRVAFAVMVPLVALQAVLALLGFSPGEAGGEVLAVLQAMWMIGPLAMAIWAGILANQMFKMLRDKGAIPSN